MYDPIFLIKTKYSSRNIYYFPTIKLPGKSEKVNPAVITLLFRNKHSAMTASYIYDYSSLHYAVSLQL